MKLLLIILLIIQIISAVIVFFTTLSTSLLLSILTLFIAILQIVLTIAVIYCLDSIEDLRADYNILLDKLHKIEDKNNPIKVSHQTPALKQGEESKKTWKCIKCETVNKAGSKACEKCGAEYSSWINPTFDSNPNKMSRFLKEKKKRK